MNGIVFDIREFTVHDGPGFRTTVFLKGCPLRCPWCHNPEGISPLPQVMRGAAGERTAGREWTSADLAALLVRQARVLRIGEGGVTFSGGEPLLQAGFVAEVIGALAGIHVVLDTSGFAEEDAFRRVAGRCDLVLFDLKLADPEAHRRWTGADNGAILRNLDALSELAVPFVARIPLVPGVTDTAENLAGLAAILRGRPGLVRADLLPYNRAAGAKHAACGMEFRPDWDETRPVDADPAPFLAAGIEVSVR